MKKQVLYFLIVLIPACNSPEIEISQLPPLPEPISNNAVASYQDGGAYFLYSFGGIDSTLKYDGIHLRSYQFSSKENSWHRLPDLPDTLGKVAAAASRIGDIIYIVGGYHVFEDGHELSSNKVHRFHIPSNTFLEDAAPLPVAIDDHVQSVWKDSLLFVVTGWSDVRNTSTTQIFNPAKNEWVFGTPTPSQEEYMSFGASGAIVKNELIYTGGAQYEKFYPAQNSLRIGSINSEDPTEIVWRMDSTNGRKAYRAAALEKNGKILWVGGSTETYNYDAIAYESRMIVQPSNQILEFDPPTGEWTTHKNSFVPMDLRNVVWIAKDKFVIVGGIGNDAKVLSSVTEVTWPY